MILSAAHAIAVNANAWQQKRQFDYGLALERAVLNIMRPLERNQKRGCSPDTIAPVVAAWAGPLAKWVKVEGLRPRSHSGQMQLVLSAKHPIAIMELKPRLAGLLADLKSAGIREVSFR